MGFSSTINQLNLLEDNPIERAVENMSPKLREAVLNTIVSLAQTQLMLSSDDVNKELDRQGISLGSHSNAMGGLMRKAASMRWLRRAGYTSSKKPGRNGSVIRVWESLIFAH